MYGFHPEGWDSVFAIDSFSKALSSFFQNRTEDIISNTTVKNRMKAFNKRLETGGGNHTITRKQYIKKKTPNNL